MRKLVLKMSMSLDGFVAGPNGEMDWALRTRSKDSAAWVLDTLRWAGLHAVGRCSYQAWTSYWPQSTDPMAAPMNDIPKVVFTHQQSLRLPARLGNWSTAHIANGDLADEIRRLKNQSGNYVLAQGGVGFARSLVRLGLIDEYRLVIHPVALGAGRPLFSDVPGPLDLQLVDSEVFASGVAAQVYRPQTGQV